MNATDVLIAIYKNKVDAVANAQVMQGNGYDVSPILEVSDSVSWSNFTTQPNVFDDANMPAWVVIGRRPI
jgi:hypothetical protein